MFIKGPYQRYLAGHAMPLGVVTFTRNLNGEVVVKFGERRCRIEENGEFCGVCITFQLY